MNLRDLKYLIALADYRHFGKAAEASFVSQPALSMQIKKLEDHLKVQLLERNNKSVLFTEVGQLMVDHARKIIHQVDEMRELARLAEDPFSGEIHLGVIPTLAPYLLPHMMPSLSKLFPKLTIYLAEEQTNHLMTKLKLGKLDAALLALPVLESELVSAPLFTEEFVLAVSNQHTLAKQKSILQDDLEDKVLLLLEDGHCLRDQALELCRKVKALEAKCFRATSLETLRHMVAANVGITLMPKLSCKSNDGINYIPFKSPKPTRTIGLVWRASSAKKIVLKSFVTHLRQFLSKSTTVSVVD